MTTPVAIIVGAIIIGAAQIAAQFVAPYQISSGPAVAWKINKVTGAVQLCLQEGCAPN